ncbi:MAG: ATP-binding protein [bacterium]
MYLYFSASGLFNAITCTLLGYWVYKNSKDNKVNRLFAYLCFGFAAWSWPYVMWPLAKTREDVLFWFRVLHYGAIFIPVLYFHFVSAWLGTDTKEKKWHIILGYCIGIFFCFFVFTPLFIKDMQPIFSMKWWAVPGVIYYFYLIFFFFYYIYASIYLFWGYRKLEGVKRVQTKFILTGIVIAIAAGSTNYFLFFKINIPPYGNILASTHIILGTYAILKHHLFNIKAIAAEFITFIIWIFLFFRIIVSATPQARIIDSIFFLLIVFFGVFLIKSVNREVEQREQLAYLNTELKNLNEHLEDKVKEQTQEIRKAYEVEKKARQDLEELDKAKTDFMLTTQHHLRTPLTVVKGVANMLVGKKEGDTYTKLDTTFIEKLNSGANKLVKLINDFLDISQMEVGKSILNKQQTSIHQLIDETQEELSHEIEQRQLHVETTFTEEAKETTLYIDPKRFRDAISNLMDNAVKYTSKDGTITIHGEIALHPIEKTKFYRLTITDTGIGITEEEKGKIFTRSFERGTKAKEMNATGRGIGLMLTKQIIEVHGGTIHAESAGRDTGSTFVVELPVV